MAQALKVKAPFVLTLVGCLVPEAHILSSYQSHASHMQVSYCEFMPLSVPPLEFKPSVSELGRETVWSLMRSWMHYSIYLFKILDPPLVI